jgi:Tfp pilus assembly PilM family ATPase
MLLSLFLPEFIKGKRILSKRIVGISHSDSTVDLTLTHATRSKTTIEAVYSDTFSSKNELGARAKSLLANVGAYDYIRITIPSTMVFFKELTLPFKDINKIRVVVDYEVEPMLPFPLKDAIIDFIITHQDPETQESRILIAAVRKQDLQAELDLFKEADIIPTHITVDVLALYGLYREIPLYRDLKGMTALIDCSVHTTKIAFLEDGKLRLIRSFPKGQASLVSEIANATAQSPNQVLPAVQSYLASGDAPAQKQAIDQALLHYLQEIQFTLNSFSLKLDSQKELTKILFIETAPALKGIHKLASKILQAPCEKFDSAKILDNVSIARSKSIIKEALQSATHALAASLIAPQDHEFNLRRKEFELPAEIELRNPVRMALALVFASFFTIGAYGYFTLSSLSSHKKALENNEMASIKKALKQAELLAKKDTLIAIQKTLKIDTFLPLLNKARALALEEQNSWEILKALPLRSLHGLYELTRLIDKTNFTVKVLNLSMSSNADNEHNTLIELSGIFNSKRIGEDFQEFAKFEQKILDTPSPLILITPSDTALGEHGGVKFTFKFKMKHYSGYEEA